jgi:hypothetical protein
MSSEYFPVLSAFKSLGTAKITGVKALTDYLRKLYRRLPVIREMKNTYRLLVEIQSDVHRIAATEQIEFLEFVVPGSHRYADPKRLFRFAQQTFSQHGEDGMIAEIFRRIGAPFHTFVEIGTGDGLQNNTTALLESGWRGWWIDGDPNSVSSIRTAFRMPIASGQLSVLQSLVTAENMVSLMERLTVPNEFDLLSLDIDRNTYWVWAAVIAVYRPRAAVIEYNASFPPDVDWKVEYRPTAQWNGTSYYGASLKAMELLGREHGYSLVGCDFSGVNAFFVRSDLCGDKFVEPFTAENHYEPPRYGLSSRNGHPAAYRDE